MRSAFGNIIIYLLLSIKAETNIFRGGIDISSELCIIEYADTLIIIGARNAYKPIRALIDRAGTVVYSRLMNSLPREHFINSRAKSAFGI